jgi:hypothetical protein
MKKAFSNKANRIKAAKCCSLQAHFIGSEASQILAMKTTPFLEALSLFV